MKPIETRTAKIKIIEVGIINVTIKENAVQDLNDAKENIASCATLANKKKLVSLIDIRLAESIDREARNYYGGPENARITKAMALLIDSGFSRVMGNFFLGLNKPKMPTKLFTEKNKAIDWLKGFIE